MPKIVILGAGLTGLSLAYHLEKQGFFDYQIFEKDSRPGGLLKSIQQDGYTFDHTGHFLHISNSLFENFLNDVFDLGKMNMLSRRSYIYSHGTYTPYPFQKNLYGLPTSVISECIAGFAERRKHIRNPKNFYQWVAKNFGLGLGKHFFFPYNTKLMGIKPKELMPSWTSRFVPNTTLKDLLEGSLERKEYNLSGYNGSFFYPKIGGIEQLVRAIVAKLKNKIYTQHSATHIDHKNKVVTFNGDQKANYQLLFSTIPMPHLLKSFPKSTSSNLNQASEKLVCSQVINFNLGINRPSLSPKHWVYFPEKRFHIYRMGFWHNFSEHMAPEGASSLYGEVSFKSKTDSPALRDKLESKAISQTLQFMGINESEVATRQVNLLDHAYVTYDEWREKNLTKIHKQLQNMSIHSIGRFGHWKYSSMQEAVLDGIENSNLALEKVFTEKASSQYHCTNRKPKNLPAKECNVG